MNGTDWPHPLIPRGKNAARESENIGFSLIPAIANGQMDLSVSHRKLSDHIHIFQEVIKNTITEIYPKIYIL